LSIRALNDGISELRLVIMRRAWLDPVVSARMDKHFSRLRSEVPHLKRSPSEYIREQVWSPPSRWKSRPGPPVDRSVRTDRLESPAVLDRTILTGIFDDRAYAFKAPLSEAQRDQLLYKNAQAFYGIR